MAARARAAKALGATPDDQAANDLMTAAMTHIEAAKRTIAESRAKIASVEAQIRALRTPSENLLKDIITDANGVVFHRFQSAAWTVVLGIVFVIEVYKYLAMPTFDNTLLGLQGLSVATYLGLKIPEPDVAEQPEAPAEGAPGSEAPENTAQ
jgi:hypothetical protein